MARKVGHVPSPTSGSGSTIVVPDDVKTEIEELIAFLLTNPNEEGFAEFEHESGKAWDKLTQDEQKAVKTELNTWQRHVRIYTLQRPGGEMKFRQLPSKHLNPNQVRFQITKPEPKKEEKSDISK